MLKSHLTKTVKTTPKSGAFALGVIFQGRIVEPEVLLAQLRALDERTPEFSEYSPLSKVHSIWLAQAKALIGKKSNREASSMQIKIDMLATPLTPQTHFGGILQIIQNAIAELELDIPDISQSTFKAGEVYDFFRSLNKVVASAEKSIFIVDPYLDDSVFNHYLTSRAGGVNVRLLTTNNQSQIKPAADKYIAQYGSVLEVKKCKNIHDRVIFIDGYVCWVIGQSLKDAAKAKPTYLSPLAPDVVSSKLEDYETIWNAANEI
jgi:hypothetical protein